MNASKRLCVIFALAVTHAQIRTQIHHGKGSSRRSVCSYQEGWEYKVVVVVVGLRWYSKECNAMDQWCRMMVDSAALV